MDPPVVAALVAATASLLVAIVTFFSAQSNQRKQEELRGRLARELEQLKQRHLTEAEALRARLTEGQSASDARRDYEYEARKRLYQQLEPLRFEFLLAADAAYARIRDLARAASTGDLDPTTGWLSSSSAYFTRSTAYRLLAPLAVLRLAQRSLTIVDLRLDRDLASWHLLGRQIALSFSQDVSLAGSAPIIAYETPATEQAAPRQGVYVGLVERVVDRLLASEGPDVRVISFGQFQEACDDPQSPLAHTLAPFWQMLVGFHPMQRPVAWRIFVAQACLLRAGIMSRYPQWSDAGSWRRILSIPADERTQFDWRSVDERSRIPDAEVLVEPFDVAEEHLARALERSSRVLGPR